MTRGCRVPVRFSSTLNLSYGSHFDYLGRDLCQLHASMVSVTRDVRGVDYVVCRTVRMIQTRVQRHCIKLI